MQSAKPRRSGWCVQLACARVAKGQKWCIAARGLSTAFATTMPA
jgi:hypothetical protein